MKNLLHRWQLWRQERRLRRNRAIFESLLIDPRSGVQRMVTERVQAGAMQMVINWLDNKRIKHCTDCPATDTLRNDQGVYRCEPHFQLRAALREKEQKTKALKKEVEIA